MSPEISPEREARIRAEVERAVAPYADRLPPWALDKMRELAEHYWREHPEASAIIRALEPSKHQIISGVLPVFGPDGEIDFTERGKEQA
ncbi:MAG: hypothetical protein ABI193_03200 [Minicystis sp.]